MSAAARAARTPADPPPGRPAPNDPQLARELLDGLAEAVLTTDHAGRVTLTNAMAGRLLPELPSGTDLARGGVPALARAVAQGTGTFDAEHHGRRLRGTCRPLAAGGYAWYVRDVTDDQARADALLAERHRTAFLARAGSRLGLSLHREQTLQAVVTLPVPYLADAALVVHRPPHASGDPPSWLRYTDGEPGPVEVSGGAELAGAVPRLGEALGGETTGAPWLDTDPAALGTVLPTTFGRPDAVLVAPMPSAGGPVGALLLVRRADRAGFDQRDIGLVREFTARAGSAIAAAELYGEQAHLARVLQHSLLPPRLPRVPGVTLAGGYRAAGDTLRIGGDFYEVFPTASGALFALGDVCGKGVGAAVLTGRVRQSLQTLRLVEQRPRELVELLNRALFDFPDTARRGQFTTLLLGTTEPEPGGGVLVRVAGGGHPSPLVVRADGSVVEVRVGGMPIGAFASATFAQAEVRLAPGELLLAYTDGVTEARGGAAAVEMFGEHRLRRALATLSGLPPGTVVDRLLRLVDEWLGGESHDDIAMLAICAADGA
ncbi:PP2C family protein-serine/threonine phosphatase [Micromonospora rifamycinica]|uniref:PP2C family protein-serine/threonine phosphatase n=1 Tax=Micromonospora rifamycinica TaxID=291594 RepID=UPI001E50D450|nr:PP2C family protein-serine/threonine phosphatase [Micromonospora rifamycinica]